MAEIRVLYDNHADDALRPGWGFSAFVRTEGAVVLFDAGADKLVLEHNAAAAGCNLDIVTAFVLSHDHCDHMGAISSVIHEGLRVYVPAAVRRRFGRSGSRDPVVVGVKRPIDIVPGVRSIGQHGRQIPEQAILVESDGGPVLITGCAHPGIVKLARHATDLAGRPLSLVMGGFHLLRKKAPETRRTAEDLRKLEIQRIAPCHCTGDEAIATLREVFADGFVDIRAGSSIPL